MNVLQQSLLEARQQLAHLALGAPVPVLLPPDLARRQDQLVAAFNATAARAEVALATRYQQVLRGREAALSGSE
ncbi:hypothetical protein SS50377_26336 [Spironucleus salmonicida]|uniref:Uncharacterized protein n=1 Tax=Spironucleus salmonicida TaxID=348837 RepID=V6LT91_9EUKA|nr:hypothetical protein SS50377_26331 [Spironucleus salmonicida]KAH0572127.1 hypothetical protein SS50377_26336 [Spironucleus salmonicida]|eukprot:EST47795.1 Hypothetical protein SS50377_12196 [Spironucleus salmonicida]